MFDQLSEKLRSKLSDTRARIILADGKPLPPHGCVTLTLSVGTLQLEHEMIVADIGVEGLIGMDFLKTHSCQLDLCRNCIHIYGCRIPLSSVRTDFQCCKVHVSQDVVIPAQHEMIITGLLEKGNEILPPVCLISHMQSYSEKYQLAVAKAVVHTSGPDVPVRVLNATNSDIHLYCGASIALCEAVSDVLDDFEDVEICNQLHADPSYVEQSKDIVPEHLKAMFERASTNLTPEQQKQVTLLIHEYRDVFTNEKGELGKTDLVTHQIDVNGAKPIRQAPRRLPLHQRQEASEQIKEMLEKTVIKPSSSPWASPVVLVKKKDGSVRFCIDYRKLNDVTMKDAYPIPRIDDSLDMLSGAYWFSTLDLASGYWQVAMDEKDKEKTAFITRGGLFEFEVLPFGLCNAPSTFERLMEKVLSGLQWNTCLVYLDDVIIFGKNFMRNLLI